MAGASPKSTPARMETTRVKSMTVPSIPISSDRGRLRTSAATSARTPAYASSRPTTPPARLTSTLSVMSCWSSRSRVAPSAVRTAISFERVGRAGQEQVGDVGAGDEEHEADRAQQHQQRRAHVPGGLDAERGDEQAPVVGVVVRVVALELLGDGPHLPRGLLHRNPWSHARDEVEELRGAVVVRHLIGLEDERGPDLGVAVEEIPEPARHHPDDFVALAVQGEATAHDVRRTPEDPPPGIVAQNRDPIVPGAVLTRLQGPSQQRGHLERGEELAGHALALQAHRLVDAGEVRLPSGLHRHGRERAGLPLVVEEPGHRYRGLEIERRVEVLDGDQLAGIAIRQRPEQHRVHRAEDRGVGPDAEGEGEDDDAGEGRALRQAAEAVTEVLQEGIHRARSSR